MSPPRGRGCGSGRPRRPFRPSRQGANDTPSYQGSGPLSWRRFHLQSKCGAGDSCDGERIRSRAQAASSWNLSEKCDTRHRQLGPFLIKKFRLRDNNVCFELAPTMDDRTLQTTILRIRDVCAVTGLARTTVYEAIARGDFPRPIKLLGARASGWRSDEISDYIEQRTRESRSTTADSA